MGRNRIEIAYQVNASKRRKCFKDRYPGAFRKAHQLSELAGAAVCLCVQDEHGNVYFFKRNASRSQLIEAQASAIVAAAGSNELNVYNPTDDVFEKVSSATENSDFRTGDYTASSSKVPEVLAAFETVDNTGDGGGLASHPSNQQFDESMHQQEQAAVDASVCSNEEVFPDQINSSDATRYGMPMQAPPGYNFNVSPDQSVGQYCQAPASDMMQAWTPPQMLNGAAPLNIVRNQYCSNGSEVAPDQCVGQHFQAVNPTSNILENTEASQYMGMQEGYFNGAAPDIARNEYCWNGSEEDQCVGEYSQAVNPSSNIVENTEASQYMGMQAGTPILQCNASRSQLIEAQASAIVATAMPRVLN